MNIMRRKSWSPYAVGAALGGLEALSMLTAGRPLGITTPFEDAAAMASEKIAPQAMEVEKYKQQSGKNPEIDWEWGVVSGVVLGSMLSSRLAREKFPQVVPRRWRRNIGPSKGLRYAAALSGGALMMFGARMAKGCTSGHGISGSMQFAASSWLFNPIIFGVGAAVSKALLGRKS